ncbi:MAG: NYN domain-containing protein [Bacteroidetes bacterium]|nr:NYN domain-containing protein [Bacteroidota bacterium]
MEYKRTYIDGYNVLRKIVRLERMMQSNADAARRSFVEFVRRRARGKGHIIIVFDGHGDAIGGGSGISVVFSLTRTADAWIRMTLENDRHPRMVLVVSSDNEVRAHAAACGAGLFGAQEFIADRREEMDDAAEMKLKNHPVSPGEVEFWLRQFKSGDEHDTR